MDRFLKSLGLLTFLAGISYGLLWVYQNFTTVADQVLRVLGLVLLLGAPVVLYTRWKHGKSWGIKVGSHLFFGPGLLNSSKQLAQELEEQKVKKVTVAEVTAHIIWRLTRIGLVGLLITSVPIILLLQQNNLISKQNQLFAYQNKRINSQTILDSLQTTLLTNQNEKFDTQNILFGLQNELFRDQNRKVTRQTELLESQDLKFGTQNALLTTQNDRLNLQNNLIEAERRGALVILMGNVLENLRAEISEKKQKGKNDINGYNLSTPLIGRIAATSQGFLPYKFLQGGKLTSKEFSIERGQLLLALLRSGVDSISLANIYRDATFTHSYLREFNLSRANLRSVNLSQSDLSYSNLSQSNLSAAILIKANLSNVILLETNLRLANLTYANLQGIKSSYSDFTCAKLISADFGNAFLVNAILTEAKLQGADFAGAILHSCILKKASLQNAILQGADLKGVYLTGANLQDAEVDNASFRGAYLDEVDLKGVKNLSLEQLLQANSLYQVKNLDPTIQQQLLELKPCLFKAPNSPNACQ